VGTEPRTIDADGTTAPSARELCVVSFVLTALAVLFFLTPIVRRELLSPADFLLMPIQPGARVSQRNGDRP
jgi:hypothetical protein